MKFIKEMIMRKNQPGGSEKSPGGKKRDPGMIGQGSKATENVPDFTDLVADIRVTDTDTDTDTETDTGQAEPGPEDEILSFFEDEPDLTENPEPGEPEEEALVTTFGDTMAGFETEESNVAKTDALEEVAAPAATQLEEPQDDAEIWDDSPTHFDAETQEPAPEPIAPAPSEITADSDAPVKDTPVKKIWDLHPDENDAPTNETEIEFQDKQPQPTVVEVPAPAVGRARRRAGRVKTRLLGFEHAQGKSVDLFEPASAGAPQPGGDFPVGWMVVVKGPGRGSAFTLFNGVSQIGRGEDQAVRLDFGDNSISRNNHAAIAYDGEQRAFFLGHGGKANLVRLNDKPVLSTEEISDADLIRIGETTLRFVSLCGSDFDWELDDQEDSEDAAIA